MLLRRLVRTGAPTGASPVRGATRTARERPWVSPEGPELGQYLERDPTWHWREPLLCARFSGAALAGLDPDPNCCRRIMSGQEDTTAASTEVPMVETTPAAEDAPAPPPMPTSAKVCQPPKDSPPHQFRPGMPRSCRGDGTGSRSCGPPTR